MHFTMRNPVWLFDLDNTLHNTGARIFPVINQSMTDYLMKHLELDRPTANALRIDYWQRYGATMLGMMRHHGTDPRHFLQHTHQFEDLKRLVISEPKIRGMLKQLPGRKVLFSNGPYAYVRAVLKLMKLDTSFERVFGVEQLGFHPKPERRAFLRVLHQLKVAAPRCILVEDTLENLRAAKTLGMRTAWVSHVPGKPACVDLKLASVLDLPRAMRNKQWL
jgi:putative hydrolase of the HAD superfamily